MWRILDGAKDMNTRAWLNGEEVSERRLKAIVPDQPGVERPGQVWLVKENAEGKAFTDKATGEMAVEVLEGMVRWEPIAHDTWAERQRPVKDASFLASMLSGSPVATC